MSERFPLADRPRLWGVAVSHYQVEGDDPCDWTDWEAAGRAHEPCGAAVRSWERYEEDVALAAASGANTFRFSISWSRVEPRRGVFDEAALQRYRRVVERCAALSLEPIVTLFHYTHPRWFHEETPWTSPRAVDSFARFARRAAQALGSAARLYTILNEPLVFLLGGFVDARIPPGLADTKAAGRALDHLLAAHVAASGEIRAVNPRAAIGLAHNVMAFEPERSGHVLDRLLVRLGRDLYNTALLEAFATGRWRVWLPPATLLSGRRDSLVGSLDFLCVNYYSRLFLRFARRARGVVDYKYHDRSGRGLTDNGWEIVPDALEGLLLEAASFGWPLLVTENGLADARDTRRRAFLHDHVTAIERARAKGAPVAGYVHWALLDNFEWLDGYGPRFGLYEVDRATMERRARPSVETFRALGKRFLSAAN